MTWYTFIRRVTGHPVYDEQSGGARARFAQGYGLQAVAHHNQLMSIISCCRLYTGPNITSFCRSATAAPRTDVQIALCSTHSWTQLRSRRLFNATEVESCFETSGANRSVFSSPVNEWLNQGSRGRVHKWKPQLWEVVKVTRGRGRKNNRSRAMPCRPLDRVFRSDTRRSVSLVEVGSGQGGCVAGIIGGSIKSNRSVAIESHASPCLAVHLTESSARTLVVKDLNCANTCLCMLQPSSTRFHKQVNILKLNLGHLTNRRDTQRRASLRCKASKHGAHCRRAAPRRTAPPFGNNSGLISAPRRAAPRSRVRRGIIPLPELLGEVERNLFRWGGAARRGAARRVYSVRRQRNRFLAAVTFGCLRTTSAIVELEAISGSYNTAHSFLRADPTPTAVPFQTTQYMPQLPSPIGQMGQYPGAQEGRFAVSPDGSSNYSYTSNSAGSSDTTAHDKTYCNM
ncbi:hypothetical protein J6590_016586 [Homalodisca vitripennis]|nr:hypothetical protein J6590_016586 [Homalodisca vitripennis]